MLGTEGPAFLNYPGFFANTTVFAAKVGLFQCLSDRAEAFQFQDSFVKGTFAGPTITKGNYAVSWGNTEWDQLDLTDPPVRSLTSAFGQTTRTISMVTDGTSNTVFISEIRQGSFLRNQRPVSAPRRSSSCRIMVFPKMRWDTSGHRCGRDG
jgi:hypothetical protein